MKESPLVRSLLELCAVHNFVVRGERVQSGQVRVQRHPEMPYYWMHLARMGTPDILGFCKDGKILAIEAKSDRGKLTREQAEWLNDVADAGGYGMCVASLDTARAHLDAWMERATQTG